MRTLKLVKVPHTHNRRAWDERARRSQAYAQPATDSDFQRPLAVLDECGWLGGEVAGKRVLCLAAGGGRHGPLFAAAGAQVTVADISPRMLALDREVAADRGLQVCTVETSMDDLSMLPVGFEIVIQPVSTCYVPDVMTVYRQVARVTAAGGLYVCQHKQPVSLQTDAMPGSQGYRLRQPYYHTGPLPPAPDSVLHREADTMEFLHPWEALLGGLCRSGFVIEDLVEPRHAKPDATAGSFAHRSYYAPPFVTVKARRTNSASSPPPAALLWTP
jgi:SAM-dependent methyltransferase